MSAFHGQQRARRSINEVDDLTLLIGGIVAVLKHSSYCRRVLALALSTKHLCNQSEAWSEQNILPDDGNSECPVVFTAFSSYVA